MRLALLVLFAVACGGKQPTPPPSAPAPAPAAPASDTAPQLFTVDQLRAGNPPGRIIELRMEAEGKPTLIEHWEFTAVDDKHATIHATTRDETGKVLDDRTGSSTWDELHEHGQFPAAATTIEDNVEITVPAGTFKARLYTVKRGDTTARFWFATDLPGPPVLFTTEAGGKIVMRGTMLRAK